MASWILQAITGVLLIPLVGLHWVAQHFLAVGGLRDFAQVVDYLRTPPVFALETAFLVVVTTHALLGVRAVILDLGPSPRTLRLSDLALVLVGIGAVGYGLALTLALIR
ncbi:MAG: hypothetical protein ABSB61_05905 [Anaerolineales bacterium]|jgi:succinate dehydrogenase hydrophobic anchor subunit